MALGAKATSTAPAVRAAGADAGPPPAIVADLELFAGRAAHDLKAPLRQLSAFCELLARHESDNLSPDGREYLSAVRRSAVRMTRLVDGLMAHARLGRGSGDLWEEVDLDRAAAEACALVADRLAQAGGAVTVGPLGRIVGVEWRIAVVLQNLVANAVAYRRAGAPPQIHIFARRRASEIVLTVADNGVGVPEEDRDRIFEPFERGAGGRFSSGVGLGLANCRRAVEELGGDVWVEPNAPHGSRFCVRLPVSPEV